MMQPYQVQINCSSNNNHDILIDVINLAIRICFNKTV